MTQAIDKILEPCYYYMVKFLEKPAGIVDDYACVPDFWIEPTRSTEWNVSVAYPVEDQVITKYRAKRPEKPRTEWKYYQAIVEHKSSSYIDPEIWSARYHATVKNNSWNEKGYQSVSALDGMAHSSRDFPSSLYTKTLQTVVQWSHPLKPSQKPMVRVSPVVRNQPESPAPAADINENRSQTANAVASTKQSLFEYINPIERKIHAVGADINENRSQSAHAVASTKQSLFEYINPIDRKIHAVGADINENRSQTAHAVASTKQSLFEYINPIDRKIHAVGDINENRSQTANADASTKQSLFEYINAIDLKIHAVGDINENRSQTAHAVASTKQSIFEYINPIDRKIHAIGADINENRSQTAHAVASTKLSLFEYINPIDMKIRAMQSFSNLTNNYSQQPKLSVQKQLAPVIQNSPQAGPRTPEIRGYISGENLVARSNNFQINTAITAATSNEANQSLLHRIAEIVTLISQSVNDKNTKQNHIENASDPQCHTEETRSNVRKPKLYPNNSKWTLKYRRRERGLEELVQDTGIYVNVIELAHCRRSSDNCNTLARLLLSEVFSRKALTLCSLNGTRGKFHDGNNVMPGLDEFAIKVILKFVEDYGMENQWDKFDYKSVTQSMHYEISKIRAKYGK